MCTLYLRSFLFAFLPVCLYGYGMTELEKIFDDFWEWRKLESPEFMSYLRIPGHNDLIESYNISRFDEKKEKVDHFRNRLKMIDYNSLTEKEKLEYDIFEDYTSTYVTGYKWRFYQSLNPISFMEGLQTNPTFISHGLAFSSRGDYENYIDRLLRLPTQIQEIKESFREAISRNHTYHMVSVQKVPQQIKSYIKSDPRQFALYKPLNKTLENITWISVSQKNDLRNRATEACREIMKTWDDLADFMSNIYFNYTRSSYGISGWNDGAQLYKDLLRWHLSLDISPEKVHKTGLDEVARITNEMKKIFKRIGHNGTVREFFRSMKNGSSFTFSSKTAILNEYKNVVYKRIYPAIPQLFNNIPENRVRIEGLPYDGAQAVYVTGSADGSVPGRFMVNLFRPKSDLKFTFMALSLHESVPGHHMQTTIQSQAKIPKYRRTLEFRNYHLAPFHFPFYTAYVEGWGLYSEFLGEELGLYKDDFERIGRYSFEIFRACRLVVDTGIHYFNWTREKAINYMMNYTILSQNLVANDVDRYMTWPGQACAYKIGELKVKELRRKAENALGDKFNLKDFHDVFLQNGPMPLRILEKNYNKWIERNKFKKAPLTICASGEAVKYAVTSLCLSFIVTFLT